jgi:hypothetical protein
MKMTNERKHVGLSLTIMVVGAEGYLRATRRRLEDIALCPTTLQPEAAVPPVYD